MGAGFFKLYHSTERRGRAVVCPLSLCEVVLGSLSDGPSTPWGPFEMGLGLTPILQLELPTRLCCCFGMERASYYLVLGRP